MKIFKNPNKVKWFISFFLIAVLLVGMIFALVKINNLETTKNIPNNITSYEIGCINENGEYVKDTSSIYLKKYYDVDGLTCDLEEDASITYKIAFYNTDKEFIEMTEELSADFESSSIPADAEYFRIMITPTNDAEVSFFEINGYADMLTVTVNK